MERPLLFITNDDGIGSPGLKSLAEAVAGLGELLIVAPSDQQTGIGRSLHGDRDACLIPVEYALKDKVITAYHCQASPARTVSHAFNALCGKRSPDLLLSGINYGENLGTRVTSSGTIGAALEGASLGIPSLAISRQTKIDEYLSYDKLDWTAAAYFAQLFTRKLLNTRLPFDVDLLKLDIPLSATPETPWRITRVSRHPYYSTSLEKPDLSSKLSDTQLHIGVDKGAVETDSDIQALFIDEVVSVTPMSLDLTSRTDWDSLKTCLES